MLSDNNKKLGVTFITLFCCFYDFFHSAKMYHKNITFSVHKNPKGKLKYLHILKIKLREIKSLLRIYPNYI